MTTAETPAETSAEALHQRARLRAERSLGTSVMAIEFTLISVMVGVVLFPLAESATSLLRDRRVEGWAYLAAALMLTLHLWTSVIVHALTFVSWPMDFGRNLLYIGLGLVMAMQMHFLDDPVGWFALSAVSAGVAALTVLYDTQVLHRRVNRTGDALLAAVLHRQRQQVRLLPAYAVIAVVPLLLVTLWPGTFVHGWAHLALVSAQALITAVALVGTVRAFDGWADLIVRREMAGQEHGR